MNKLFDSIYQNLPNLCQNSFVSIFNIKAYSIRHKGKYNFWLAQFKMNESLSIQELQQIQSSRLAEFISFSKRNSRFYSQFYRDIGTDTVQFTDDINKLPILDKETLRQNISRIYTLPKSKGIVSKTGGTSGKSLEVIFTKNDMQERFAMLDNFRRQYGYKLGKKTAWFSGKNILNKRDISKNRFWKTDYWYKVRYYSTFHIKEQNISFYLKNLNRFKPEFMVGFSSNMVEIANYGIRNGISIVHPPKAIFPTSETVTDEVRTILTSYYQTKVIDQYASSEGAPFIFECRKGKLHMELQSGVFEVLDENDNPSNEGRLIVTSFTTHGTPLIRYDIGDTVKLSDEKCTCGNNNPLVNKILGRIDDYIYSPQNGKINLGNVSNTLKDTKGIIKFQAIQDEINQITIKVVKDKSVYTHKIEQKFVQNWRDRIGRAMNLKIEYVDDIPVEKSGKYRIVKNNIKHLINA